MLVRTVVACIAACLALSALAGISCNKNQPAVKNTTVAERTSVAPGCLASGKHCTSVELEFKDSKPSGSKDDVAKLIFTADSDLEAPASMSIIDPKQPHGTTAKVDCCALDLTPQVGTANITSENGKECYAMTRYDINLSTAQEEPIADFQINDSGTLSIVTGSVHKPFDVQLISTRGRSIYIVFRVAEVTAKATPLFAMEWVGKPGYHKHIVKAADGWSYEFRGHDGKLGFFHASCLGTLPDDLQMIALEEQDDRSVELKQWIADNKNCGAGG